MQWLGVSDSRFNWENFGNQPGWLIFQTLEKFEKFHRRDANHKARTAALGWTGLFNGFKDKNASPMDPSVLVPYPDGDPDEQRDKRALTYETAKLLAQRIDKGTLPHHIIPYIQQLPEVQKWLIKNQ